MASRKEKHPPHSINTALNEYANRNTRRFLLQSVPLASSSTIPPPPVGKMPPSLYPPCRGSGMAARDAAGEVRAVELDGHPFFVGTLFQPERSALRGQVHPLLTAFVAATSPP